MYFGKMKNNTNQRIPPDQNLTTGFPVLHHGDVPNYHDVSLWNLKIFGEGKKEVNLSYQELMSLPQKELKTDIHCVTGWSKLDNVWTGINITDLLALVNVDEKDKYVIIHAEFGFTTNLPIADFIRETSILAHSHNGKPLSPEHGFPFRLVVPHLYFWKSAKWVRGIELVEENQPGFWERNGYHMYGDPWRNQRYEFND